MSDDQQYFAPRNREPGYAMDQTALPHPRTRLIGREHERDLARALLVDEAVPLVTLAGTGGVGKTRLALAVAASVSDHFADGMIWVDLAPVGNPSSIESTMAGALGLVLNAGDPIDVQIGRFLRPRQVLLVLDNCEHLLPALATIVAPLLARCPAVQILATSRAPLRIRGEFELVVPPLPLPPAENLLAHCDAAESPAVQLFLERATAANAAAIDSDDHLLDIAEICRSVDGLPLAIELAAARVRVLPLAALRARLHHRLPLLGGGPHDAPARQRSVRETIAWSYDLLTASEQALIRRLSVFTGGFSIEAAHRVGDADASADILGLLERLAEHHLIASMSGTDEPRFTMLETIREFGLERLEASGEAAATRDRHAAYFMQLVDELDAFWAPFMPNARQILDQLDVEYANLQSALEWLRDSGDIASFLELAGELYFFWQLRGRIREGRALLEWGLRQDGEAPGRARAAAQISLAGILFQQADLASALELCDESIHQYRECGDAAGIAHACECATPAAINSGQLERGSAYMALAFASLNLVGNTPWLARLASHFENHRGAVAMIEGKIATANQIFADLVETQRALACESGVEDSYACWPIFRLGITEGVLGSGALALERIQAAIEHARKSGEQACVAASMMSIARLLATEGRWREAAQLFGAPEAFCDRAGYLFWDDFWPWERAYGLPEPWQGDEESLGTFARLRAAIAAARTKPPPPVPDPAAAAELWAAGRDIPVEEALAYALSVNLAAQPADLPAGFIGSSAVHGANRMLSRRERDVLTLLCERLTDPQIAERLYLSPRTVESHVSSILGKLGVENRRDAAAAAVRMGLL